MHTKDHKEKIVQINLTFEDYLDPAALGGRGKGNQQQEGQNGMTTKRQFASRRMHRIANACKDRETEIKWPKIRFLIDSCNPF